MILARPLLEGFGVAGAFVERDGSGVATAVGVEEGAGVDAGTGVWACPEKARRNGITTLIRCLILYRSGELR
jgi:hypothetical protein